MCFGMIYGGILFMDYVQYNHAAGAIARDISLNIDDREQIIENINRQDAETIKNYSTKLTNLYDATFKAEENVDNSVTVTISFTRNATLPTLLNKINFPPENLSAITVKMPLKK